MTPGDAELRDLMIRYQAGDSDAIDTLVSMLSPALLRYLCAFEFTRGEAEDALQDTWLRLHRSRHTYRPSEPVLPWVFAIARHARLDAYRRRRRLLAHEISVTSVPESLFQGQQPNVPKDDFLRVLDTLPESQREVILMLKVAGMTLEEVARAKSTTVGAIKLKAHRAYEKLRTVLANTVRGDRVRPENL